MKRISKAIVAVIISVAIVIFSTVPTYCMGYTRTAYVVSVDYELNEWVVLDTTGNLWSFSDGEDLLEKDIVLMEMDDNNTTRFITDDLIKHVYYIGYFE